MRTVVTLAVGFWLGRQLYVRYDREKVKKKQERVKSRLEAFLKENGLNQTQVEETVKEIIN
ncbi:MAG: hypothetical protein CMD31_13060 [Flavobacteriales bacterium]|jgi:hypothetical protein|nr:hypothetical protein [Flavobacteriales bacterium]|tara:strand:- start:34535 stop:34717 length:183 start_codon:yes stop_codon:yes gene_type:complete